MSNTHSKIISNAAKSQLASLGFRQKGRSRLWLADRKSWLNVVKFTPSSWSKSVSLVNAAHWLWVGQGHLSFNESVHANCHAQYETDGQFEKASLEIAKLARANALAMEERFPTLEAIADFSVERARSSPDRMALSWWGFEAGIASGLMGRWKAADSFLRAVTDPRVIGHAEPFIQLIDSVEAFTAKANDLVAQQRSALKLELLESGPF